MGGEQDAHELGAGVDVGGDLVGDGLWLVGRRSDVGRQRHVLRTATHSSSHRSPSRSRRRANSVTSSPE